MVHEIYFFFFDKNAVTCKKEPQATSKRRIWGEDDHSQLNL